VRTNPGPRLTSLIRRVPDPTVGRLSTYLHCLRALERNGIATVSSAEMADQTGINAAQIRKDVSYIGELGRPGVGYDVGHLKRCLMERMGLGEPHGVVLVGAGSLGAALCSYPGFAEQGFFITAVFDNSPAKVGRRLGSTEILSMEDLPRRNRDLRARIGVIAVPRDAAQTVADCLVAAGIRGILNFAPIKIEVREGITVRNVDLAQEFEALSYYMASATD